MTELTNELLDSVRLFLERLQKSFGVGIGFIHLVALVMAEHQPLHNQVFLAYRVDAVGICFCKVQSQAKHFLKKLFAHTAKVRDVAPFFYCRFAFCQDAFESVMVEIASRVTRCCPTFMARARVAESFNDVGVDHCWFHSGSSISEIELSASFIFPFFGA